MKGRAILNELRYALYIMCHPFDGFWCLKKEKRGTVRASLCIMLLLTVLTVVESQETGFILNYNDLNKTNVLQLICSVWIPYFIWCVANWCITTLVDGEGSFKDISVTTAYALAPMILFHVPMLIISRFIIAEEATFYYMLAAIAVLWSGFLIFVGLMTVHQFTPGKTLGTMALAVVAMAIILFLALLFVTILQQFWAFINVLLKELSMRR